MARYYFYPPLSNQSDFNQLLARLAWFFPPERLEGAVFFSASAAEPISLERFECPGELTSEIGQRLEKIKDRIKIQSDTRIDLKPPYDAIFLWRDSPEEQQVLKKIAGKSRVWRVDRHATRMEGSFWIEALHALDRDREEVMRQARARLKKCAEECKGINQASIITSGPSAASYKRFDFSDDLVIFCNSVVADSDLLNHLKPRILCFADPIFHFGPSLYTQEFYRRLRAAVQQFDPWVIVPWKYRKLLLDHMPEIEPRLIALPFNKNESFNFDLLETPEPKVTDNILTYLLIPVAASFCKKLRLLGCDGRPMAANQYFWAFNPRTQFAPELMQNIQNAHPGFFNIDYNDYYTNHCQTLERQILQLEGGEHRLLSLATSHIPVLQRRSPPPTLNAINTILESSKKPVLISLNPNLKNHFGHYYHFDCALEQAFQEKGYQFITLSNRDLQLADEPEWPVLPFFSQPIDPSNKTNPHNRDYREWLRGFRLEINSLIEVLAKHPDKEVCIFLYMTNARIVQELVSILSLRSAENIHWVLNLCGIYAQGWPPSRRAEDERWKLMQFCANQRLPLLQNFRISLTVDSHALAKALESAEQLPVLPMFQMTPFSSFEKETPDPSQIFKIVYPTNAQQQKGFDLLPEAINMVQRRYKKPLHFCVRTHIPIEREKGHLEKALSKLPEGVEQIAGVVENEDYLKLLSSADVIILPYRANSFSLRTSGQLVDAILLSKPVVATRETWAGEIVDHLGCGVTFRDGDCRGFANAMFKVLTHYDHFKNKSLATKDEWIKANNSDVFANKLLASIPLHQSAPPSLHGRNELAETFKRRFYEQIENKPLRRNHFFDFFHRISIAFRKYANIQAKSQ